MHFHLSNGIKNFRAIATLKFVFNFMPLKIMTIECGLIVNDLKTARDGTEHCLTTWMYFSHVSAYIFDGWEINFTNFALKYKLFIGYKVIIGMV